MLAIYISTLVGLYSGVQSGLLGPVYLFGLLGHRDATATSTTVQMVVDWMQNRCFSQPYTPLVEEHPHLANLAVVWIAIQFTEPIRLPLSIAFRPRFSNYLGLTKTRTTTDVQRESR